MTPPADKVLTTRLVQAFGLGTLVGAVLLSLVWVTVSDVTDDPVWPLDGAGQVGLRDGSAAKDQAHPGPTRLQRCATVAEALAVPVRAAGPALDRWEVHVGAMNKLVAGTITLQQAQTFWSQTRVGAKKGISDFRAAERTSRQEDVTCPVAASRPGAAPVLASCLRQVEANRKALEAARTAVSTWAMHVADMEALRSGKLSPTAATQMWLSMWKRGVAELRTFHAAERAARGEAGCRQVDPAVSRFVRPRAGIAVRAMASADLDEPLSVGQPALDPAARGAGSGRSPEAADPPGATGPRPAAPQSGDDSGQPAAVPQVATPPIPTPTTGGEAGTSAPPSTPPSTPPSSPPPTPPTGGAPTPAPAPAPGTPSTDPGDPGKSGPHRQDRDPGRAPLPTGQPSSLPCPVPAGTPEARDSVSPGVGACTATSG